MPNICFNTESANNLKLQKITQIKDGEIEEYKLELEFFECDDPKEFKITWQESQIDSLGFWSPNNNFDHNLTPEWWKREVKSDVAHGMPLASIYSKSGENRLTISLSDPKNSIKIRAGVVEENGKIEYDIIFFSDKTPKMDKYEAIIRLDRRKIPFYKAAETAKNWWCELGYKPSYEPKYASAPLYSAWYSFHQRTIPEEIIAECKVAKKFGMDTLIVDDGWQTDDNSRGYGYCGDWEVCEAKIPDMKDFVDKIHELDMKFMIWFSVPYVGYYSKNFERFKGKYLSDRKRMNAMVLDPRFKDVRDFIVDTYVNFVNKYGIDGLKLDFIDSFSLSEESSTDYENMDTVSVADATEKLLSEISEKLKAINPEFLIEFRQSYIGPVISQYGNMFRVTDCPNDALLNRVHSLNMRMVQNGIVHSDMMMWSGEDTNEAVIYQLLGTMFCVPQISIRFDDITSDQKKILGNYISFWRKHKETILHGEMEYFDAHANYSRARSTKNNERVSVLFNSIVEDIDATLTSYIFNASGSDFIYVEANNTLACEKYNEFGELTEKFIISKGVSKIPLNIGSMIKIN